MILPISERKSGAVWETDYRSLDSDSVLNLALQKTKSMSLANKDPFGTVRILAVNLPKMKQKFYFLSFETNASSLQSTKPSKLQSGLKSVRSEVPLLFCLVDHLPRFPVFGRPPP